MTWAREHVVFDRCPLAGLRKWDGLGPPQLTGIAPAGGLDDVKSFSVHNV